MVKTHCFTKEELQKENVVLFELALLIKGKVAANKSKRPKTGYPILKKHQYIASWRKRNNKEPIQTFNTHRP